MKELAAAPPPPPQTLKETNIRLLVCIWATTTGPKDKGEEVQTILFTTRLCLYLHLLRCIKAIAMQADSDEVVSIHTSLAGVMIRKGARIVVGRLPGQTRNLMGPNALNHLAEKGW